MPRYIADLDCYSLLAIVATAPQVQAQYLRDFVFKHLAFKDFIGVQLPVRRTMTEPLRLHILSTS